MFGRCFVTRYLVSFLVLQSSAKKEELFALLVAIGLRVLWLFLAVP